MQEPELRSADNYRYRQASDFLTASLPSVDKRIQLPHTACSLVSGWQGLPDRPRANARNTISSCALSSPFPSQTTASIENGAIRGAGIIILDKSAHSTAQHIAYSSTAANFFFLDKRLSLSECG